MGANGLQDHMTLPCDPDDINMYAIKVDTTHQNTKISSQPLWSMGGEEGEAVYQTMEVKLKEQISSGDPHLHKSHAVVDNLIRYPLSGTTQHAMMLRLSHRPCFALFVVVDNKEPKIYNQLVLAQTGPLLTDVRLEQHIAKQFHECFGKPFSLVVLQGMKKTKSPYYDAPGFSQKLGDFVDLILQEIAKFPDPQRVRRRKKTVEDDGVIDINKLREISYNQWSTRREDDYY